MRPPTVVAGGLAIVCVGYSGRAVSESHRSSLFSRPPSRRSCHQVSLRQSIDPVMPVVNAKVELPLRRSREGFDR